MEGNDELDRMIDGALAGYPGAEPLAGLEERVINRVRLAEAARRRTLGWTLTLAAAVSVLLVAIVVRTPHAPASKNNGIARVGTPAPLRPAPVAGKPRVAPKQRGRIATKRAPSPEPLPKEEQFPAPAPMTADERALLAFVEHQPREAQQVFAGLQKRNDEPIDIQPIQIPPLRTDGAQ